MDQNKRKRVVIIGAGFGGLWTARELANTEYDVILIDKNNYHTFLPLLYQVSATEIEPEQIASLGGLILPRCCHDPHGDACLQRRRSCRE